MSACCLLSFLAASFRPISTMMIIGRASARGVNARNKRMTEVIAESMYNQFGPQVVRSGK